MDTITILYQTEENVSSFGIEVPRWISQDIDASQVAAILQGGCASGAYMPAVNHEATATMAKYGEEVLRYIDEAGLDVVFTLDPSEEWWSGLECEVMSFAVELWASAISEELAEAIEERGEDA